MGIVMLCLACVFIGFAIGYAVGYMTDDYDKAKK